MSFIVFSPTAGAATSPIEIEKRRNLHILIEVVIEYGKAETEKAILVGLARSSQERPLVERSLEELSQLTFSAGAEVLGRRIQVRPRPDPAFYIGRGLVAELKEWLSTLGANCVIFDDALSPAQQRNLEEALEAKVLDRPVLILDIFATRARTAAARLQVELAQLEYTLPRLTGAWLHFSRQYGGIGAKGPGETQLEIDRRQVRMKITHLKEKLNKLDIQRATQRKRRQPLFKVALVGYTNAGKSTLFNVLTRSQVRTADMLFTTLDSTTRVMSSGYPCRVVFSDTVGFIKKLPHQLVESFKSTLEEVCRADLLLHMVDCSEPDYAGSFEQTRRVLTEIGADEIPYFLIYNKIDLFPDFHAPSINGVKAFLVSAASGAGITALQAELIASSTPFGRH
ncbi:MAG: GTPase HflX [candidate division Zixibacteria bacterium]|nr:GTPase HflX [candidate division Zixibacteria bacterium]